MKVRDLIRSLRALPKDAEVEGSERLRVMAFLPLPRAGRGPDKRPRKRILTAAERQAIGATSGDTTHIQKRYGVAHSTIYNLRRAFKTGTLKTKYKGRKARPNGLAAHT